MIPRSSVDEARALVDTAKAIGAEGGTLDIALIQCLGGLADAGTDAERELWRGKAADQLMQAHSAAKLCAQDAADLVWSESFGTPAKHGGELGREFYLGKLFGADAVAPYGSSPKKMAAAARSWLSGECDRAYDWAMEDSQLALGDPGVRYAHVPTSPKPCELCCAIAANGFMYKKPPRASHRGCKCVIASGIAGTQVEGYDPDLYYEMWKHPERFEAAADRALRSGKPFEWENEAVSSLSSPEEVASYLLDNHGVTAQESFSALPIGKQKAAAAAFDRGRELFGSADIAYISAEKRLSRNAEGEYEWLAGKVILKEGASDAYLTAFHEYIHGVDAHRSSKMKGYDTTRGIAGSMLYSKSVIRDMRKWLKANNKGRAIKDEIALLSGLDDEMFIELVKHDGELVAHSLTAYESGRINAFRTELFRRFSGVAL